MTSGFAARRGTLAIVAALALSPACAPSAPRAIAGAPRVAADDFELTSLPEPRTATSEEYERRRADLASAMEDGVFVAFGSAEPTQDYVPYAQNANFRYLTGILEPDAGLIIVKANGGVEERLFVRRRDAAREIWEGSRLGVEGAEALTGIPAQTSDRFLPTLESLVAEHETLFVTVSPLRDPVRGETLDREQQIVQRLVEENMEIRVASLVEPLQQLRARKSAFELDMIRRAVLVSTLAHREAIRSIEPEMNEFEVHGLIEYIFRRHGAERPAFASIVGSGPNTTTLHYRSADRVMEDGDLVLMDVGASYGGYAADVTRTVPVNGRFSPDQRDLYEIVLSAQGAAEEAVRVGATWTDANEAANAIIADGLTRLGLIDSSDATYDCANAQSSNQCPQLRLFYMHSLGHGVGLDVHDPDISSFESFQVGSAFTIEPGIYVRGDVLDHLRDSPQNRSMADRLRPAIERYQGIGIRIEDVYILTEGGLERVSRGVPREVAEVEALRAEHGLGQQNRRPDVVDWYRGVADG